MHVVRALFGDGRTPERAAHHDAAERARLAADLAGDVGSVGVNVCVCVYVSVSVSVH
ncbi:MAG TPA: hypothetical protein VIL98_08325 [Gaiellaceae bacterium]